MVPVMWTVISVMYWQLSQDEMIISLSIVNLFVNGLKFWM